MRQSLCIGLSNQCEVRRTPEKCINHSLSLRTKRAPDLAAPQHKPPRDLFAEEESPEML